MVDFKTVALAAGVSALGGIAVTILNGDQGGHIAKWWSGFRESYLNEDTRSGPA